MSLRIPVAVVAAALCVGVATTQRVDAQFAGIHLEHFLWGLPSAPSHALTSTPPQSVAGVGKLGSKLCR